MPTWARRMRRRTVRYVTAVSQREQAGRSPRGRGFVWAEIAFVIGLLAFWLLQYSRVILQSDDLLNAAMAGRPDAEMTVGEWWEFYRYDYLHVNGRFTDSAVRVVLQGGRQAWAMLGPVLVVGVAVGGAAWVTGRPPGFRSRSQPRDLTTWSALAICATLPFFIVALRPTAAGDGIFWLSAALTHLGSAVCVLAGGWPFIAKVVGRECSRPVLCVAPVFLVLAGISQETASVTMLAVVAACWVLVRGRMGTYLKLLSAASVLSLAYVVLSPGLRGRASAFQAGAGDQLSLIQQLLHRAVVAGQIWLAMTAVGVFAVIAMSTALLWLAARRGTAARWPAALLTVVGLGLASTAAALGPWTGMLRVIPRTAFVGGDIVISLGFAACLVGSCIFGLTATYLLRDMIGPTPFVLVTAGSAALAVPAALGITGERAYLITALWWGFTAVSLLLALVRSADPIANWAPAAIAVAAWLVLIPTVRSIDVAMTANYEAWQDTAHAITRAQETGSEVTVGPFPYPAYMCWAAFDETRYGDFFRLYYDLPPQVEVAFHPSTPAP